MVKAVARARRYTALLTSALLAACALVAALYWLPLILTRHPKPTSAADVLAAQNGVRAACIAALVALGTATTATIAWRAHRLTQSNQYTERYSKAVEQVSDERSGVRVGGVYALEALARDSRRDAPAVVEVLASLIRSRPVARSPVQRQGLLDLPDPDEPPIRAAQDYQAALQVLGRLPRRPNDRPIDLRNCDLALIEAPGLTLERVWFHKSDLSRTRLAGAKLDRAGFKSSDLRSAILDRSSMIDVRMDIANAAGVSLIECNLSGSRFRRADLCAAFLMQAQLQGADFSGAVLRGARFDGAFLDDANFEGADLTGAYLIGAVLKGAKFDNARVAGARFARKSVTNDQLEHAVDFSGIKWD